jgi:FAD/FMN-containing dehydrogenase
VLQHEGNHVLEEFQEVREMQRPIRELWFGKKVTQPDGTTIDVQPGIITDEWLDTTGAMLYGRLWTGGEAAFRAQFESQEQMREYIRRELLAELSGASEAGYGTIREGLDSVGQSIVDRVAIASKNSMLGRTRAALEALGITLDNRGDVSSVIFGREAPFNPEALALMRQFKRSLDPKNIMYPGKIFVL